MAKNSFGFLESKMLSAGLRRWSKAAQDAKQTNLSVLREQRKRARMLKHHVTQFLHVAEERLALPMIGSNNFSKPHNCDWAWRPNLWRSPLPEPGMSSVQNKSALGDEVVLFHDCSYSELTLRQVRNLREVDLAPYGVRLDVFQFNGSFLSLVVDLPKEGIDGLKRNHLLRVDAIVELEKPIEMFVRLNIKHGPNTEQIVRELVIDEEHHRVEFDMAYSNLNEKRVENAWIDVIFERPQMNQVILRDVTLTRRPRAHL